MTKPLLERPLELVLQTRVGMFLSEQAKKRPRLAMSGVFVGGFLLDTITLNRIDAWFDNILLLSYVTLLTIVVGLLVHGMYADSPILLVRRHFSKLALVVQFLLGALFSASVIFYSQSASISQASWFIVILVALMVMNEIVHTDPPRVVVLLTLYFFTVTCFLTFFLPVVTKRMNAFSFLAAGVLTIMITSFLIYRGVSDHHVRRALFTKVGLAIAGVWVVMMIFYFNRWIPPVPLAMRDGGVYTRIVKRGNEYLVYNPAIRWYQNLPGLEKRIEYVPGDTVFAFSSIFAPTRFSREIEHQWKMYDEPTDTWRVTDRLPYTLTGGRKDGYRGYTFKRHLAPGKWRVDVVTDQDWIIGRLRLEIVPASPSSPKVYKTEIK